MRTYLIATGLLGIINGLSVGYAQELKPVKAHSSPTFFVGAHYVQSRYEVFYPTFPHEGSAEPWLLTVGLNLSPRFALQLGYSYARDVNDQKQAYLGTTKSGKLYSSSVYEEQSTHCIPLLARYSLIRATRPRVQLDLILGLTLLKTEGYNYRELIDTNQVVTSRYIRYNAQPQLYATGGFGLRYLFNRHFEGVFDWTYSQNFHETSKYIHLNTTGNIWGLTSARTLGLRYCFDLKKKPPTPAVP